MPRQLFFRTLSSKIMCTGHDPGMQGVDVVAVLRATCSAFRLKRVGLVAEAPIVGSHFDPAVADVIECAHERGPRIPGTLKARWKPPEFMRLRKCQRSAPAALQHVDCRRRCCRGLPKVMDVRPPRVIPLHVLVVFHIRPQAMDDTAVGLDGNLPGLPRSTRNAEDLAAPAVPCTRVHRGAVVPRPLPGACRCSS